MQLKNEIETVSKIKMAEKAYLYLKEQADDFMILLKIYKTVEIKM